MSKKILLIEDDEFVRDIYQETLQDASYTVETAKDGEEGITKAQAGGYSLILLDMMMPKLNGLEVLKHLKENPPKTPNDAIVLLTNLAQDPVIQEGLHLGAKAYLIKSDMNPDEFLTQVKKYL